MANFKEQRKIIQNLRKKKEKCDEQLYFSKLKLQKTESLLRQRNRKETIPHDKKDINKLRDDISRIEAQLQELNRQTTDVDNMQEKIRDNNSRSLFLEKKIEVVEAQLRNEENRLRKEKKSDEPDKKLIKNLERQIEQLQGLLYELKTAFKETGEKKAILLSQQREKLAKKERINAKKRQLQNEIVGLEKKLSTFINVSGRENEKLEKEKNEILKEYEKNTKILTDCSDDLHEAIENLYGNKNLRELITELDDNTPFLLLPLRIETRFVKVRENTELWLRIYPDDIAIHTHEKLLTDSEVVEGMKYWKELFNAEKTGGDQKEDKKKFAWSNIASLFGPQRSAWITKQVKPTNWTHNLGDIDDEGQLIFSPHSQTKTHAWSRAPRTKILPDKFVVMLYEGDTIVREEVGRVIPDELFVGPDPLEAEEAYENKHDKLVFGESFTWTSDFEKAVQVGMGFRIPLASAQAVSGFDKLLVLGVYLSADETEGQKCLEELIDNHHYSPKGFSLVLQGTPTNNTEADGSGYTKNDPFSKISYLVEAGNPLFTLDNDCDGRNLADALGIEYDPLQNVLNSDAADYQEAVAMNRVLYPATLGYFFETLLQPVFGEADLDAFRQFFVNHVTGRGPLPTIRVGNQPYGILLTSDFGRWEWNKRESFFKSSFLNILYAVMSHYQNILDSLLKDLMYVGKPGKDPSDVLMNILGLQAGSVSFYQRIGYSSDYLKNLDDFQHDKKYWEDIAKNYTQKNDLLNFFTRFGYNTRDDAGFLKVPQALRLVYQHYNTLLDAANLIDNAPLSEKDLIRYYDQPNKKNYLHWLAEASTIEMLEQQNFGAGKTPPNSLLYMKLRRALLLQLHKTSVRWFKKHNIVLDHTLQARNFHNIRPQGDLTKYEVMKARVGFAIPEHPQKTTAVSDYLLTTGKVEDEAQSLNEMRAALKMLAEVPTAKLERCFTEHLDACTYRLDAWQTALFRLRLLKQRNVLGPENRKERKKGIYIGAYGWLENIWPGSRLEVAIDNVPEKLRPVTVPDQIEVHIFENEILKKISNDKDREKITSYYLKDNDKKAYMLKKLAKDEIENLFKILKSNGVYQPLFEYADNGGFVHAPSLNHASTAAILRSGYLSHADSKNPDTMAVNLSSERVRRALFVLQGMRNGQALEALLGYQFERGLHGRASADNDLIKLNLYIYDFRDRFPYQQHQVRQQGSSNVPTESIPAGNVVNGIALAENTLPFPYGVTGAITAATDIERNAIEQEKDKLIDTLDAVKDLLLAESTYQMVQGNFDRSGSILNALKDTHLPPELDVINTPRSSHFTFTNRVTVQFENADPGLTQNNPWSSIAMTPRAKMEAGLNKWLGNVLGNPADIVYRVAQLDVDGDEVDSDMTVKDLSLQPIDLIYIIGNELNTGVPEDNKEPRTAASELESRIAYRYRQLNALNDDVVVRIEFMKPEKADKKTLGQLLPLLRMLKSMITDARHLHAEDFAPSSKTSLADKGNPKGYDVSNLQGRIINCDALFKSYLDTLDDIAIEATVKDNVYTRLKDTFAAMDEAKVDFEEISFTFNEQNALQDVLMHIADFGVPDAFPKLLNVYSDKDKMILLGQARSVARRIGEIHTKATALSLEADAATEVQKKVYRYVAAGKVLLGDVFNVLPVFTYSNEADIQQSNADRAQLLKYAIDKLKTTFVADEWLQNVSHVRPKLARWDYIRTLVELFNKSTMELKPVQLPYRAKDSWLAVEFPEKDEITNEPFNIMHDTLSVVIHGDAALMSAAKQCGLLIDDWTEVIPVKEEITGITFNYNQPNACPPQAILLAVTPKEEGRWTWDKLVGILNDTLRRAKQRAVEPIMLDKANNPELNVLLPAIVADFSQYDLDVSLDYRLNLQYFAEAMPMITVDRKA